MNDITNDSNDSEILSNESVSEFPTINNLPVTMPGFGIKSDNNLSPVKPDNIPNDFFDRDPLGNTLVLGGRPALSAIKQPKEKTGWWEQAGHAFFETNRLTLAGEYVAQELGYTNPGTDYVPEDFTAMNPENVEGYDRKYWDYITDAKSPNDLKARQDRVRQQMEDDEKFADGSITANLLGGLAGVVTDPTSYLIPMAVGLKYSGIAQNIFMNVGRASSGIALDSLSRNALIQADRAGGNLQDLATNSLTDFIFGTALVGSAAAMGGGLRASKLWNMRKSVSMVADGVKLDPVVSPEGILTGEIRASAMPGVALSADVLDAANLYASESMAKTGLFSVPYVGESIQKFLGWGFLATPSMKAANSSYSSVRSFFNRIAPTGLVTEGEAQGSARPDTAYHIADFFRGEAKSLGGFIRSKFYEANGIEGGATSVNALKNFKQTYSNERTISEEDFGKEVRRVSYEKDYQSPYTQANDVANAVHSFFDNMGEELFSAMGEEGKFLDPRTAWRYLPQNYNIPAMINKKGKWLDTTIQEYINQDELIRAVQAPVQNTESRITNLKAQIKEAKKSKDNDLINNLENELKGTNNLYTRQLDEQVKTLRDNHQYHILLEDRIMFDSQESAELGKILEPVESLKAKISTLESDIEALKTKITKEKKKEAKELHKLKLEELKKSRLDIETKLENEQARLDDQALSGKIDKKFFKRIGNDIKFYDPNLKPQLRKPFDSQRHMELTAAQVYDSILNQTPTDLLQNVLGKMQPGIVESPAYLKSRTHLVDSQIYNDTGFLDADISKSIAAYATSMGRIIGFKKAFPEFSDEVGLEGVLRVFNDEHKQRLDNVKSEEGTKEGNKERQKLNKDFQKAQKFMKDTYNVYMGTYASRNPELQKWSTALKNMVVSAKLGAVPLYQLSELGAIVMKTSLMPFFAQGLRPLVKSMNGWKKGIDAEVWKQNAAHAHLATNDLIGGYAQKMINGDVMSNPPLTTGIDSVGVWSENLAHVSSNLFGINAIANVNERWMASAFQSEVMQAMFSFKDGTITKNQTAKMARYGIDVEKWSERFIENFKNSGGWSDKGGHQSLYFKWQDLEASNRMSRSIRRAVQDTVVNGNIFTSPYWTNNPFGSMLFMFHGWAYGALNHYAIPFMQRPTADATIGLGIMTGLSLFSEPLLRILNGKEAYEDDTSWFDESYKALDYSGILGPYASYLQDINNLFGGALVPHLQTERAKNIQGWGKLGPIAGYLGDIAGTAQHVFKGDLTQGDAKRAARLAFFSSHLAVRGTINNYIENSGLPESRRSAQPWAWRAEVYGEGK